MLVERIGASRVIAHRVDVAEAIALTGAVHDPRALSKPEILLAALAGEIVIDPLVPPAEVIGLGRSVACDAAPFRSHSQRPGTKEAGEPKIQADRCGFDA